MTDFIKLNHVADELDRIASDLAKLTNTRELLIAQTVSDLSKEVDYSDEYYDSEGRELVNPPVSDDEANRLEMQDMPHEWQDSPKGDEDQFDGSERGYVMSDPSEDPNAPEYIPPRDPLDDALEARDYPETPSKLRAEAMAIFVGNGLEIPENCDFGDDVSTTEMIDNDADLCQAPSCVNERMWAKRREVATSHREDIMTDALGFGEEMARQDEEDEGLTEDEKMAQAGMSDDEIAAANHIESLNAIIAQQAQGLWLRDKSDWGKSLDREVTETSSDGCEGCGLVECMGDCDDFMADIRSHEANEDFAGLNLVPSRHIRLTIEARRAAKAEGNCEDGYDVAGDALHNAVQDFNDSDKQCPTFVVDVGEAEDDYERECAAEWAEYERDQRAFEDEQKQLGSPVRAVHIPATEEGNLIRQWFDTSEEMHQFLAGGCFYAEAGGKIRDVEGAVIGVWYVASFNHG